MDRGSFVMFYERHDFQLVPEASKALLLRNYWTVSERQIETSVVLAAGGFDQRGSPYAGGTSSLTVTEMRSLCCRRSEPPPGNSPL